MSKVNQKPQHVHLIEAKFMPCTNYKPTRVKLTSLRFERDSLTDSYSYEHNGCLEQAAATLATLGYTVLSTAETPKGYALAVAEFKPLRESLAEFKAGGAA